MWMKGGDEAQDSRRDGGTVLQRITGRLTWTLGWQKLELDERDSSKTPTCNIRGITTLQKKRRQAGRASACSMLT